MPNHLVHSNSPYLLQHADNPVNWYPWGSDALEKALSEDKPIFLSIGYAACHWCHVMAHESFEDPATAALMNEHFINIKVDREERPDLDSIYMSAVVAMTGQGGWPMSVFLTPDGQPFFGGTYFPPIRRYNMPSFQEVLTSIARLWRQDRGKILKAGQDITEHIRRNISLGSRQPALNPNTLSQAAMGLAQSYDWQDGGWGQAPKFPQPMTIEFLLRRAAQDRDKSALEMAFHALRAMAKGGMYDVVGGGFARYSTDDKWLTPHFEKMLYDNAQLALAYLHGYLVCRDDEQPTQAGSSLSFARHAPALRQVCEETLDFVLREMTHPGGGFYSSLDADSEGEEGKFYLWTTTEIIQVLGTERAVFLRTAYGVTEAGNFEGRNILQRHLEDALLAERYNLPLEAVATRLKQDHADLLAARAGRVRPATDDKVLVAWNGLMLVAFAEAARYLQRPDYLAAAQRNAGFLLSELRPSGRLLRSWRAGKAQHNAYLEDYAALILGLLALYQSDPNPAWFAAARELTAEMATHFQDPAGGFFDTRDDHENLITRPKDLQDNATPSGSAMAATALLHMAAYTGEGAWRDLAESALRGIQEAALRYPTAFARWLSALHFALGPVQEVAILGDPGDDSRKRLVEALWSAYRPNLVAVISECPPSDGSPELLADRPLRNGRATAYVCQDFACQQPVNTPEEMLAQLAAL